MCCGAFSVLTVPTYYMMVKNYLENVVFYNIDSVAKKGKGPCKIFPGADYKMSVPSSQ